MMIKKIIASVVVALTLGAGVAYAATQLASTDSTQVCVNQTNGLMRASSTCRDGEYAMTIGGGSDIQVTQGGTFTVDAGVTSAPVTLPLTGVSVSGKCELQTSPPAPYEVALARFVVSVSSGTMDVIASSGSGPGATVGTIGGTSVTTTPLAYGGGSLTSGFNGVGSAIATANGATATITVGAHVDATATPKTCSYLWQATEAPN
jgi:hypothetical protein